MAVKWNSTNFPGVRFYKHDSRKHGVKFDQYFSVRFQVAGRTTEEGLGWASEGMTAEQAYQTRSELKEAARTGKGASSLKQRRRAKALAEDASPSFDTAAEAFIKHCTRTLRPKTIRGYKDGLAKVGEITPAKGTGKLKNWKLDQIQRRYLAQIIDDIAETSPSVAIQVRSSLSALYAWAIQSPREYIQANIIRDIPRPPKPAPKERYLTGKEAGVLWRALQKAEGDPSMIRAIKFALLVGCRISEASGMTAKEVDGDWWTIPAERFKGKRPHRIFLTRAAKDLITGNDQLIFPSQRSGKNKKKGLPFDTSSFSSWLRRNNYFGLEKFTAHDFRRTLGSGLAMLKFSQDIVAVTLGHKLQGVTAEHYIRHKYDDEKQTALECWEAYLLKCAGDDTNKADVIPIHAVKGK